MTKFLNQLSNQLKALAIFVALASIFTFSVPAHAATTIPSESPDFKIDLTACLEIYNFATKVADIANGLTTTKPYDDKGCVRQPDLFVNGVQQKSNYCDFEIAVDSNKNPRQDFCNLDMPVVGIQSQNLNVYNVDGTIKTSEASVDRSSDRDLNDIFTDNYKCRIYKSLGSNCLNGEGIPRWFSTGEDKLLTNTDGSLKYLGGRCSIENGNISVRTSINGLDTYDPADYNIDVNDPINACAFPGSNTVQDRSLRAYQFVYVVKYPTTDECKTLFGYVDANVSECLTFFRDKYGKALTGNGSADSSMFVHTHTFYASWDDGAASAATADGSKIISFNFLGWENPDVFRARANATDAISRSYDGYSTYVF
ncbi:MAG: hypothetical protein AAGF07_03005 [Patescibacteria group bacterium]